MINDQLEFATELSQIFKDSQLCYIDAGAHNGSTFLNFSAFLNITEAFLFEPNPNSFDQLKRNTTEFKHVSVFNIALSDKRKHLWMENKDTMSKVVDKNNTEILESCDLFFKAPSREIDSYFFNFKKSTPIIFKIDVEGHEQQLLKGATNLLSKQVIDIIYIEAGFNLNTSQQTYYRNIEDLLNKYNYYIFKIYEQKNEWPTESPLLRRANFAFFSKNFSDSLYYSKKTGFTIKNNS